MQSSESRLSNSMHRPRPLLWLAVATVTSLAGLVCYGLAAGARPYTVIGEAYPGAVTAVAEPVGYFIATAAGGICLGGLLYVVIIARPDQLAGPGILKARDKVPDFQHQLAFRPGFTGA